MNKTKIKISFRYDGEIVIIADDNEREMILKDGDGVKQEFLEKLNYYMSTPEEEAKGAISDWNFEVEEVEEI